MIGVLYEICYKNDKGPPNQIFYERRSTQKKMRQQKFTRVGTGQGSPHSLTHGIFSTSLRYRYCGHHFTEVETDDERGHVPCPISYTHRKNNLCMWLKIRPTVCPFAIIYVLIVWLSWSHIHKFGGLTGHPYHIHFGHKLRCPFGDLLAPH